MQLYIAKFRNRINSCIYKFILLYAFENGFKYAKIMLVPSVNLVFIGLCKLPIVLPPFNQQVG